MKSILTLCFALFASSAVAETCEESVAKSKIYSEQLQIMEMLYEEAGWLQKTMVRWKHNLEIEAVCDVKLNRGHTSKYWTIPGNITDESYFQFAIDFYGL